MGLLSSVKRGFLCSVAAIAMASASGFCIKTDYSTLAEEARQEYIYTHQDSDGRYDYDAEMIGNLESILSEYQHSTREINTAIFYKTEGGINAGMHYALYGGSCLMLDNGYILTAGHVIEAEISDMVADKWGGVVKSFETEYYMPINGIYYELKNEWDGSEDFALLRFVEEPPFSLPSMHFVPGDTDNLANGSITYTFSALNKPFTKEGHVYNALFGSSWERQANMEYFLENTDVNHGDSGGPVIAFLDGTPQLVGVTCYMTYVTDNGSRVKKGGILKINRVMEEAGRILDPPTISNP